MKKIRFVFLLLFLNIVSQLSVETEIVLNDTSKATNAISSSLILDNNGSSDFGRPVPVNEAFELSAILTGSNSLSVKWNIKKNYYLYQDKISFTVEEATIKNVVYPEATIKNDEFFGEVSVYTSPLEIQIEVEDELSTYVILAVEHQGCWEGGVCYPPQVDRLKVSTIGAERITCSDRPTATDSEKITSKKFEQ